MITYNNDEVRLYGLSTDAKPTDGIENGTTFVEMDTSDQYYFNEAAGEWVKKNSSGGGGGLTVTPSNGFIVEEEVGAVYFANGTTLDKNFGEIVAAAESGASVNLIASPADAMPGNKNATIFRLSGYNGGLDWYAVFFEEIFLGYDNAVHIWTLEFTAETEDGTLTYFFE